MRRFGYVTAALLLIGAGPATGQTVVPVGSGLSNPQGVAVDPAGNVFVADTGNGVVKEATAASGYTVLIPLGSGFSQPVAVALDKAGNVFVADDGGSAGPGAVYEIPAAGGYNTTRLLHGGFATPIGVAVDSGGDVFVVDGYGVEELSASGNYATVTTIGTGSYKSTAIALDAENNLYVAQQAQLLPPPNQEPPTPGVLKILAAGGYTSSQMLGMASGFIFPTSVAIDAGGNVYVGDPGASLYFPGSIRRLVAVGNYTTIDTLDLDFSVLPQGIAVDGSGNVYFSNEDGKTIEELVASPSPVLAAVLPGTRAVQLGTAATIYASMINTAPNALSNCQIALTASAPTGLTLGYQTTDPTTNALTGTPNTPVTIPGNDGVQSFVITFQSTVAVAPPGYPSLGMPLDFVCDGAPPANSIPGIDTVDVTISTTATADIIALAATPSQNDILELPSNGAPAAFAVASINLGATDSSVNVSIDTGTTILPTAMGICQTDPSQGGQCLAPPSGGFSMNFAAGATPTFSVFVAASDPIVFDPGSARIFVRFTDSAGIPLGSTSVAIETK